MLPTQAGTHQISIVPYAVANEKNAPDARQLVRERISKMRCVIEYYSATKNEVLKCGGEVPALGR